MKSSATASQTSRVLVFSKTKGFYHSSIPSGIAALQTLGKQNNFIVDTTKNAAYFNTDSLKNYSAVIFLSTTLNVLNPQQQVAFERYIQAGGGYVGIHAAADTEYDWPWYNKLVGAYFTSHPNNPNVRKATIDVVDTAHASTKALPAKWERTDEWYNYRNIQSDLKIVATLDEDTYEGGTNGNVHPIAWYHEYDGGRAFYTGGGHTDESFSEPLFLQHLLGGIRYAIGANTALDYSKAYAVEKPEDNRFTKTVLSNDLNEPMELAVAPDGRVFFVERAGNFYVYEPAAQQTTLVHKFLVEAVDKYLNGLLGMSIDPDFAANNYIYFFYTAQAAGKYKQHISRFTISKGNKLDLQSEKVIIEIPIDLEVSAHTGGSIAWDRYKNMYISTGDNTVPFESEGYAPIDCRPDRLTYTAERSAGNTNDLRGKILRIHPEADGSYTIPDGNLFPKRTAGTRPEIYVMGCRNPYRMSVDTATSYVYWGEVGPDAGTDGLQGPRGYDEFNQARKAGNFGWPYFVGDNKPYKAFDFATRALGENFDPAAPQNLSQYNTGLKTLPPTQKPMVWYPYAQSTEFPFLGEGGRCAMGGPVYHFNAASPAATRLPQYYDKALFMYDWMRNWVYAVRLDGQGNYIRMEQFMETNGDFRRPVDIEIGPDGVMYMLEYGTVYGIDNVDARLVRIDYNGGNRTPVAKIATRDTIGMAPYKVTYWQNSYDYDDDDKLSYEWLVNNDVVSTGQNFDYTFQKSGVYNVLLKVTDAAGKTSTDSVKVVVGNTAPQVAINTNDNGTFFTPTTQKLKYKVEVKDAEDKTINPKTLKVLMNYIAKVEGNKALVGHQTITPTYNYGKELIASSDCKACHQVNAASVGPSFMAISKKYAGKKEEVNRLADKIIKGGGGVWGEHAMSAHPQLSQQNAIEMVNYIMSVGVKRTDVELPQQGITTLDKHTNNPDEGRYILSASYTDKGGAGVPALTGTSNLILRPAKVQAEDADFYSSVNMQWGSVGFTGNRSYIVLKNVDLKNISELTLRYSSRSETGRLEVHLGALKGPLLTAFNFTPTNDFNNFTETTTTINAPQGRHDLYFVYPKKNPLNKNLVVIDWVRFGK